MGVPLTFLRTGKQNQNSTNIINAISYGIRPMHRQENILVFKFLKQKTLDSPIIYKLLRIRA
ncbi:MAG: hypothetical protein EB059_09175 [Alphaproteobacteria bacterium]|nr:hypothetical protein [Alphaproteobacteria bacterium]